MPHFPTNAEKERRWIEAWSDLAALNPTNNPSFPCILPDGGVVNIETCQGWLQSSAYKGYTLSVAATTHRGGPAARVDRFEEKR